MPSRNLPPARLLSVFEAVTRCGSIQRAAADLNVTQPAVSQSLRNLEIFLGIKLFDRGVRPAALTPAGRTLQQGVSEGMATMARALGDVMAHAQQNDTAVTIACTLGTATYWLMPRLTGFYTAHPEIAVNVRTTAGLPTFQTGVDMVIRYGKGDWGDGDCHHLASEWVLPVCSPSTAPVLAERGGLAGAPLLHVDSEEASWLTWPQYFANTGVMRKGATLGRRFSNYVQATQAALAGQGVLLGWRSNAGDLIDSGQLVPLTPTPYFPPEAFYLVVPRRPASVAARSFQQWALTELASP